MATHIKLLLEKFLENKKKEEEGKKNIEKIIKKVLTKNEREYIYLKKIAKKEIIFSSNSSNFFYIFNLKKEILLKEIKKESPEIESIKIEPK